MRAFDGVFKISCLCRAGVIDAGNFKGTEEVDALKEHIAEDAQSMSISCSIAGLCRKCLRRRYGCGEYRRRCRSVNCQKISECYFLWRSGSLPERVNSLEMAP